MSAAAVDAESKKMTRTVARAMRVASYPISCPAFHEPVLFLATGGLVNADNFWFWFGGIWLAVGVPFLLIGVGVGWYELTLEGRLARTGESASGVVLVKSWDGGSEGRSPSFRVQYRFSTSRSETVRAEASVSEEAWESYHEQEPVSVTYLPQWPRTNRIPGRVVQWLLPAIFGALGSLLTLLGGFIVLKARRMKRRRS